MSTATSISADNSQEQDISHSWSNEDSYVPLDAYSSKGKGKERESGQELRSPETSSERLDLAYPPTTEDAEETRRVEENLRRWEIAERQRRKAARESVQGSGTPSVLSEVSRRASLLWGNNKNKNRHSSLSLAMPVALHSQDNIDVVPLTHTAPSPASSPTRATLQEIPQDPFNPPAESLSPFSDSHRIDPPSTNSNTDSSNHSPDPNHHPHVQADPVPHDRISPPTPSITQDTRSTPEIRISHPPRPTSPPQFNYSDGTPDRTHPPQKPVRWWHEWLCGCSEGPDRGGDHQAGRTNPFE